MVELIAPRLKLREVNQKDLGLLLQGFNDERVTKYLGSNPFPFTLEHALPHINYCLSEAQRNPRTFYSFILDLEGDGIGEVGLSGVHHSNRYDPVQNGAYLSFWLLPKFWRRGFMSEALDAVVDFSFDDLNLELLYGDVASENLGSCALLEKKGFVLAGVEGKEIHPEWDMERDKLYVLNRN